MSVAIVLGAGGSFGWAFHLGVLDGVREALGHEPAGADRIVGTSAGGAIAATLLAGSDTGSVLETVTSPPSDEDMAEMRAAMGSLRRPWRHLRPVAPQLMWRRGWRGGLATVVGVLPAGLFPTSALRRFPLDPLDACSHWPHPLWVPAVRLRDGRRVVFGRDRHDVDVRDAIEATSAVPGMFRPKQIGDDRFVDGGVRSATNADLLLGGEHRVALVASPMTRPGGGVLRRRARRHLATEVADLRRSGTAVVVVEPDERMVELASGFPRTAPEAGTALVDAARAATEAALRAGPG